MPRYIDADAIHYVEIGKGVEIALASDIDKIPTISPDEARGVVHCGECVHADKDMPGAIYCTMWDAWEVPEDGFCYKGAKMEVSE